MRKGQHTHTCTLLTFTIRHLDIHTHTQQRPLSREERERVGDGGWEGCFHGDQGDRRKRGSCLPTVVGKVNDCH